MKFGGKIFRQAKNLNVTYVEVTFLGFINFIIGHTLLLKVWITIMDNQWVRYFVFANAAEALKVLSIPQSKPHVVSELCFIPTRIAHAQSKL